MSPLALTNQRSELNALLCSSACQPAVAVERNVGFLETVHAGVLRHAWQVFVFVRKRPRADVGRGCKRVCIHRGGLRADAR